MSEIIENRLKGWEKLKSLVLCLEINWIFQMSGIRKSEILSVKLSRI